MTEFNVPNELVDRAHLCQQIGDFGGAEKLIKRAIKLVREESEEQYIVIRYLTLELSENFVKADNYTKAESCWKNFLARQKTEVEVDELEISKTLVQMALFYTRHQKWRQAKIRFNQAIKIQESCFSKEVPDYVLTLSELARLLALTGKWGRSEKLFIKAQKLAEEGLGDWDEYVALVLRRRALAFRKKSNPELLEPYLERAVAILADDRASPHPELSKSLTELADLSHDRGFMRRAEKLYVKSLQLAEPILGSKHAESVKIMTKLAGLRRGMGKFEEAELHYRKILTILKQVNNTRSLPVAWALFDLGSLLREVDQLEEAEPVLLEALDIQQNNLGKDHASIAKTLYELATLHRAQNKISLAEVEYNRALAIREKNKRKAPNLVAETLAGLAQIHRARSEHAPAEKLLLEALSLQEEAYGPEAPQLVEILNSLGKVAEILNDENRAIKYYERANVIKVQQHGFYCRLWLQEDSNS